MVFATVHKFSEALAIGGKCTMACQKNSNAIADNQVEPGKLQAAAKKRNTVVAVSNLMMAFMSEATMG
jgi:dihydroorotase-like cyclic amidohydrolase